jgi:hypothetical protein
MLFCFQIVILWSTWDQGMLLLDHTPCHRWWSTMWARQIGSLIRWQGRSQIPFHTVIFHGLMIHRVGFNSHSRELTLTAWLHAHKHTASVRPTPAWPAVVSCGLVAHCSVGARECCNWSTDCWFVRCFLGHRESRYSNYWGPIGISQDPHSNFVRISSIL